MADAEHPLLADLTVEQRDAVTTNVSPLCVIAGAGSGKTRVLTRRIAWQTTQGHADPRRVLAVTFTRRAARELRDRLRRLGLRDAVRAGTFHAVALAQLRRHAADAGRRPPRILASVASLVSELRPRLDRAAAADIANEIGWCRARLVAPQDYADAAKAARRRAPLGRVDRFAKLYAEYEEAKQRRRVLDFDDVLVRATELMEHDERHAAAQRWLHQHLLVDEFQDINPLQFRLLRSWLGPDSTLLVVGDPDQAIYGWNGADPELMDNIGEHLGGCARLHLRANFRSTPEILAAAGRVLGRDPQPAVRPTGDAPTVSVCDGADEAAVLARAVRQRHRPGSVWRRQAVLARTNAQLEPLRRALVRQQIPVTSAADSSLIRQPEVAALLEAWPRGASLAACVADTRAELHQHADTEARSQPPPGAPGGVEALLAFAEDHLCLDRDASVGSFAAALRADSRSGSSPDGVALLTFHAAKGLEWPVVHLVGLEDGYVPIAHARSGAARAEERRLLHVAVTRAAQELHVLWCDRRSLSGTEVERSPSPWLAAIAEAQAEPVAEIDPLDAIARARGELEARRARQD